MNFKVEKSEIKFRGKVFDLQIDEITYDSGNKGIREIALHPGGAVVVPVTNEKKIVFVKQYRYPFKAFLLELPAGKLEYGEDPFECAKRELTEETGYCSENISALGRIFTTPGFCNEILHIYLAQNLTAGNHSREEGEYGMEVHEFTIEEVNEKIKSGEIVDSKTISGLHQYKLTLNSH